MTKYRIERESGRSFLVINSQKEQQISEREFYCVSTGQIEGLVRVELSKKSNSFKLMYDISGLISLREFLYNPMDRIAFCRLFSNILRNLKNLQNAYFNQRYLLLDLDAVMINPQTQAVSFIYVPITFYENVVDLKGFLLIITEKCSFVMGENTAFIGECRRILNSGINFSLFELEEFISGLSNNTKTDSDETVCKKCGEKLSVNANFCSVCGQRTNEVCIQEENIYDPLNSVKQNAVSDYNHQGRSHNVFNQTRDIWDFAINKNQSPERDNYYQKQFGGNQGGISNRTAETSVIWSGGLTGGTVNYAELVNVRSGERITIQRDILTIGKDSSMNDFCIRNNAVSRTHARIRRVGGRWYISDLNSTNKTYLNGSEIYPNVDIELFSNTKITFANEVFIFIIH